MENQCQYKAQAAHIYANIKQSYKREYYCQIYMKRFQRSLIAKLCLGILPIREETGRYNSINREERLCLVCNNGDVEDEHHIMFYCIVHSEIRSVLRPCHTIAYERNV